MLGNSQDIGTFFLFTPSLFLPRPLPDDLLSLNPPFVALATEGVSLVGEDGVAVPANGEVATGLRAGELGVAHTGVGANAGVIALHVTTEWVKY